MNILGKCPHMMFAFFLSIFTIGVSAEIWTDYTPSEQVTELTVVDVKTNYLDDYLMNLKTTWVKAMEVQKEMGSVVDYGVWVANGADSPNVWLTVTYKDMAALQGSAEEYAAFMAKLAEGECSPGRA